MAELAALRKAAAALEKAGDALGRRLVAFGDDISPEHVEAAGEYRALAAMLHLQEATAAKAAKALAELSKNHPESVVAVREAGGIPPLVALLAAGAPSSEAAKNAAVALFFLADNKPNQNAIREAGGIPPLVKLFAAGASFGAKTLQKLASTNIANKVAIRQEGGIHLAVRLLPAAGSKQTEEIAAC